MPVLKLTSTDKGCGLVGNLSIRVDNEQLACIQYGQPQKGQTHSTLNESSEHFPRVDNLRDQFINNPEFTLSAPFITPSAVLTANSRKTPALSDFRDNVLREEMNLRTFFILLAARADILNVKSTSTHMIPASCACTDYGTYETKVISFEPMAPAVIKRLFEEAASQVPYCIETVTKYKRDFWGPGPSPIAWFGSKQNVNVYEAILGGSNAQKSLLSVLM